MFDKEYAKKLRRTRSHDMLFNYCSSFPDDSKALSYLALCYHSGYGTPKDEQKGIELLLAVINEGSVLAQRYLGYCYKDGVGVDKDKTKGVEFVKTASHNSLYYQFGEFLAFPMKIRIFLFFVNLQFTSTIIYSVYIDFCAFSAITDWFDRGLSFLPKFCDFIGFMPHKNLGGRTMRHINYANLWLIGIDPVATGRQFQELHRKNHLTQEDLSELFE